MVPEAGRAGHLDLLVTGGTVVLPDGVYPVDVGIAGGRIAALAAPGCLAAAEALE